MQQIFIEIGADDYGGLPENQARKKAGIKPA
jgi:hypothetical protein